MGLITVEVRVLHTEVNESGIVVKTTNATYAFPWLFADVVRGGSKADIEGTVTYGGDTVRKNYVRSHDISEVPDRVLRDVASEATILQNVNGGWLNWEGRPEFSETYVDISDAEPVVVE